MTFVKVLHNYGGADTRDRRILPGIYEVGDPRLFGVAQTLLEDGHAVPFEVGAEVPAPEFSAAESATFAVIEAPAVEVESVKTAEGDSGSLAVEDEQSADDEKPSKRKSKHE